jgi:hypothetical protein
VGRHDKKYYMLGLELVLSYFGLVSFLIHIFGYVA